MLTEAVGPPQSRTFYFHVHGALSAYHGFGDGGYAAFRRYKLSLDDKRVVPEHLCGYVYLKSNILLVMMLDYLSLIQLYIAVPHKVDAPPYTTVGELCRVHPAKHAV